MFARTTNTTATADHKAAKAALRANQRREIAAGVTEETEEYLALNAKVNETERSVPWYRR